MGLGYDFNVVYSDNNHDDYRFQYKKDHILIKKYYDATKKYAPYTSILSDRNLTEKQFDDISEKWYASKKAEEKARQQHKKAM